MRTYRASIGEEKVRKAIERAYKGMEEEEQRGIDEVVDSMLVKYKNRMFFSKSSFGVVSARELIAKLYMWDKEEKGGVLFGERP